MKTAVAAPVSRVRSGDGGLRGNKAEQGGQHRVRARQRRRCGPLASQIGSGLTGVLYVLDEPSIGLHQRDNKKLIAALKKLRDLGNTVIVVEHDIETMESSDHIIDIGPEAGLNGGQIVAEGNVNQIIKNKESITGDYLSGKK